MINREAVAIAGKFSATLNALDISDQAWRKEIAEDSKKIGTEMKFIA